MNVFFLGLGGNTGDRGGLLRKAREELARTCGSILASSSVYETESWGSASDKKYLNQVLSLNTELSAGSLLDECMRIETVLGRRRSGERFSDRPIDIDILFMGDRIIKAPGLEIPHPLAHLRKFVLVPMHEIAPGYIHPTLGLSVGHLLENCPDKLSVRLYNGSRLPSGQTGERSGAG